jgi:hypothetical protein
MWEAISQYEKGTARAMPFVIPSQSRYAGTIS